MGLDCLELRISASDKIIFQNNYDIPGEATLPTSVSVVSNGDPTAVALIHIVGYRDGDAIDVRDAIVKQIPTNIVSELRVVLSERCSPQVVVERGVARTKCGDGSGDETCDPAKGTCVSAEVDAAQLSAYEGPPAHHGSSPPADDGGSAGAQGSIDTAGSGGVSGTTTGTTTGTTSGGNGGAGRGGASLGGMTATTGTNSVEGGTTQDVGVLLTPNNGWIAKESNSLGIEGAVFSYADDISKIGMTEIFSGDNACIKGNAAKVDLACTPIPPATDCYGTYWGSAIGLNLTAKRAMYKLNWHVVTNSGGTIPFNFCVSDIRALTTGG